MATYKVIQDIEAEDKLVGPLSLRQFIYAGIAAFLFYLSFISVANGVAFMLVLLLPPALFCAFFAWPWSPDQPTEVWALARIRFFIKPRRRIWDQSGIQELVTINAPRKVERIYSDNLSQTEVRSRLSALADTIDSRGWVIKNSLVNLSSGQYGSTTAEASDRLISYDNMPRGVSNLDLHASDDILDEANSPIAHQFDTMMQHSSQSHRSQLQTQLQNDAPVSPAPSQTTPANLWFMNNNPAAPTPPAPVATDLPADEEDRLTKELKSKHETPQQVAYSHLKNIDPLGQTPAAPQATSQSNDMATQSTTLAPDPAILNLANNNDLNVATLAREAHKAREPKQPPDDEVVISLH